MSATSAWLLAREVWSSYPAATHVHVSRVYLRHKRLPNSALLDTAVDPFLMLHPELADRYSLGSEARREVNVKAACYTVIDICA